ncbi:1751_t:CDS:2 [Funneliformis geosporum]|uniref:1751_t:CDS:1 n=1 Tax=Funneliformis geosporum TaxID=1117311 RepID=A0A9W4WXJ7_9GLOM|nr:1751_t:CDS:2 [Funneliformis geosporum]
MNFELLQEHNFKSKDSLRLERLEILRKSKAGENDLKANQWCDLYLLMAYSAVLPSSSLLYASMYLHDLRANLRML